MDKVPPLTALLDRTATRARHLGLVLAACPVLVNHCRLGTPLASVEVQDEGGTALLLDRALAPSALGTLNATPWYPQVQAHMFHDLSLEARTASALVCQVARGPTLSQFDMGQAISVRSTARRWNRAWLELAPVVEWDLDTH